MKFTQIPKESECSSGLFPGEGANGEPREDNFGTEECVMPSPDSLAPGQVLVKNLYLSVDPALVCVGHAYYSNNNNHNNINNNNDK